jgi:hypothetical protein
MKFIFEKILTPAERTQTICIDGSFEAKLQLGHWTGNTSPAELKADTSTGMAFKLIESNEKEKYLDGIEFVSNNHFDTDGLLACFVLLYPVKAIHHKSLLIDIATTGDFREFTSEDALKLDCVIRNIEDPELTIVKGAFCSQDFKTIIHDLYVKSFPILTELLEDVDKYESIWRKEFQWYQDSEASFKTQASVFSNYGDCNLSIIESTFPLHPVAKFSNSEFDIVLSVVKTSDGHKYELEYKNHTWFDTTRLKLIVRKSFEPLVEKLNLIEKENSGTWKVLGIDPIIELDYRMQFSDESFNLCPSKIMVFEIEEILFEYFFG